MKFHALILITCTLFLFVWKVQAQSNPSPVVDEHLIKAPSKGIKKPSQEAHTEQPVKHKEKNKALSETERVLHSDIPSLQNKIRVIESSITKKTQKEIQNSATEKELWAIIQAYEEHMKTQVQSIENEKKAVINKLQKDLSSNTELNTEVSDKSLNEASIQVLYSVKKTLLSFYLKAISSFKLISTEKFMCNADTSVLLEFDPQYESNALSQYDWNRAPVGYRDVYYLYLSVCEKLKKIRVSKAVESESKG